MRKTACFILLIFVSTLGFSQIKLDFSATPKGQSKGYCISGLTAESAFFLSTYRTANDADAASRKAAQQRLVSRYGVMQGNVGAILTLANGRSAEELARYGVVTASQAGGIITASIPVSNFAEVAALGICSVIDVGHKLQPFLDQARNYLGIDLIYNGIHLPQGYDGSGVVVGIIDDGFEYTHPSFYDTAGNTLRVKRVWNQRDTTGTAPSGFSYGSEYSTTNEIIASPTDDDSAVHGSHVAGIAAGCGAPSGNGTAYRGMAPGADIVLVSSIFTEASVLDAIQYINN